MVARPAHWRLAAGLEAAQPRRLPLVYGSTSGVYGDCGGERVAESRPLQPAHAPRPAPRRRGAAAIRHYGRAAHVRASILRIPGIYAPDREGGTPRERLLKGTPVLRASDDVYTNHIHADDLARAVIAALWRGRPQRVYNASDDTELKMGDYFDLAADLYGLPRPPRVPRTTRAGRVAARVAEFHGRVAPAGQRAAEGRTAPEAALPDGGAGAGHQIPPGLSIVLMRSMAFSVTVLVPVPCCTVSLISSSGLGWAHSRL